MNGRWRCQRLHRSPTNYIVVIKVTESLGPYSYQDSNAAVSIERTATSAVLAVLTGASSLLILPIDSTVVVILIGDVLIGDDSVDLCVMTTMIRPHSTTLPRKTLQEITLVIENMN